MKEMETRFTTLQAAIVNIGIIRGSIIETFCKQSFNVKICIDVHLFTNSHILTD